MPDEDKTVVIQETTEEVKDNFNEELTPEEMKMAEKLNLLKKEEVDNGLRKETNEEKESKEVNKTETKVELKEDDYDSFEKVHDIYEHNKDLFYSLPKAIKNHYHNSKGLYKRVKEEEEKRKKIEDSNGFEKIQDYVAKAKIERLRKRIIEAKGDPELKGLTVEEIEDLIEVSESKKEDDSDRPLTRKDLEEIDRRRQEEYNEKNKKDIERQEEIAQKINYVEKYGKDNISALTDGKYKNFDEVVSLSVEIMKAKPRYAKQLNEAINGDADEKEIIDIIIDIAKLNKNWNNPANAGKDKEDINKMASNAKKQQTSAAISSGRSGRVVNFEDLTPEDAARLDRDQWDKIPRDIRRKILMSV